MRAELFYLAILGFPFTYCTMELKPNLSRPIMNELSWRAKMLLINDLRKKAEAKDSTVIHDHGRSVGLEYLVQKFEEPTDADDDEALQRKLFQLMFETVRECEIKAKRAELIKQHYAADTAFEIGYILSDVNDKYDLIVSIAKRLGAMEDEWSPIEHMEAYEQISTQAIEINHLIDFVVNDKKFQAKDKGSKVRFQEDNT